MADSSHARSTTTGASVPVPTPPIELTDPSDHVADAVWERLCAGQDAAWLEDVRELRFTGDPLERSLDVWSIGLVAAVKDPARREVASVVLARLARLPEAGHIAGIGDTSP